MPEAKVKVALNGYGNIGKRCADSVALQDDMSLVGISDVVADYRVKMAAVKGYSIYASIPERIPDMEKADLEVAGTLEDLLKEVDIVIDATPAGIGAKNKPLYEKAGIKMIFQGGEKHEVAGHSFLAQSNYETALGRNATRVVSCNTTGICRVIGALHKKGWVKKVRAVLARRATDPWESHRGGIVNTFVPETHIPSHQGPDAQKVIPDLNIVTIAAKGPYNLSHMHFAMVETYGGVTKEDVIKTFEETPRLVLINAADGIEALNSLIELMRDMGRPRADLWEVGVWGDILDVHGDEIYLVYQVHNEAIVVPENVDAVRALTEIEPDVRKSMEKTDKALGIKKQFF